MGVQVCCPVHGDSLDQSDPVRWVGRPHGEVYPVVDGIPVLLPDREQRARAAGTNWSAKDVEASPLGFYNRTEGQADYLCSELPAYRPQIERFLAPPTPPGPVLEIGSGKGVLQGIGQEYVALDYSLTALRQYVRPQNQRICGTAEKMPFPDNTFSLIFSVAALEHVPQADLAFAEIHRILRPGGIAYLAPAWHCVQYNCEGIPVRPYSELSLRQKWVKLTLPIRRMRLFKAMLRLPVRLARRLTWSMSRGPTALRFGRLRPDYERFWISDSDAASSLDSHEGCLYFHSRGYEVLSPGRSMMRQLLVGHSPVVVRKPA